MGTLRLGYSVVVRTRGTAGEKYRALLDSLGLQTAPPREVLVIVPEGHPLPPERLGTERFIPTREGMLRQRAFGIDAASSDFLLLCDDDISFGPGFAEGLYLTHLRTGAEIVLPRVSSPEDQAPPGLKLQLGRLRDMLCGLNYVSKKPSPYNIRIWATGGYIKNGRIERDRQYYSQSGHGTCGFFTREAAAALCLHDEMWLEGAEYPLPDDQVMYYKAFLQGRTIAWCREERLRHLDAGRRSLDRFRQVSYANGRNFTIFWHRFLFSPSPAAGRKTVLIGALMYRIIDTALLYAAAYLWNPARARAALALFQGYMDAVRFLGSDRYKRLPVVRDRHVTPGTPDGAPRLPAAARPIR